MRGIERDIKSSCSLLAYPKVSEILNCKVYFEVYFSNTILNMLLIINDIKILNLYSLTHQKCKFKSVYL